MRVPDPTAQRRPQTRAQGRARIAVLLLGLVLAAVALAVPGGAAASGGFVIKGHGYGHGVGMSQWGSYGYAKHGVGYRKILGHYYSHTKIGKTKTKRVGVLLATRSGGVAFKGAKHACGRNVKASKRYRADLAGGGRIRLENKKGHKLVSCGKQLKAIGSGPLNISGLGPYRGSLVVKPAGSSSVNVINRLSLDDYVRGVVPHEVPASWPVDALEVQAVAARGYGLTSGVDGDGFSLYSDTRSQAYGGVKLETKETNRAVRATSREIVTYKGKPAQTFYYSSSGGQTEASQYGFDGGSPRPYLKSVGDAGDKASPYHSWTVRMSRSEITSKLSGLVRGKLRKVEVVKTGDSPRVVLARIVGTRGSSVASGYELQGRLGLRSSWFRVHG